MYINFKGQRPQGRIDAGQSEREQRAGDDHIGHVWGQHDVEHAGQRQFQHERGHGGQEQGKGDAERRLGDVRHE